MKSSNKTILMVLLLLLTISLAYNLKQEFRAMKYAKKRQSPVNITERNGDVPIAERYTRNGIAHAVIKERPPGDRAGKPVVFIDSLKKALAVKEKQLLQATKVNGTLKAENLKLQRHTDSVYSYRDKWLQLSYSPLDSSLDMTYSLTLTTAGYWKRTWFLAPRQYYIDIFSDDPRVTIDNVKRFTIETPKPKKYGIGLSAGYGYGLTSGQWQPYIGIGLNYNLIRF